MSVSMRIFWSAMNWMGIYAAALLLNLAVMTFFGSKTATALIMAGTFAAIAAAIRIIVRFVRHLRRPTEKTPEPVCESAENTGMQI